MSIEESLNTWGWRLEAHKVGTVAVGETESGGQVLAQRRPLRFDRCQNRLVHCLLVRHLALRNLLLVRWVGEERGLGLAARSLLALEVLLFVKHALIKLVRGAYNDTSV